MERENPHGGGVAWVADGLLHFRRGLTAREIHTMQDGELTFPYLLHFRWATHGEKIPELTHPFPVGPRALFGELEGTADQVLIHNGTWNGANRWLSEVEQLPWGLLEAASDTAIVAWLMQDYPDIVKEVHWATAVGSVSADGTLATEREGTWTDHEGNWYSNLQWLPYRQWSAADHGDVWGRRLERMFASEGSGGSGNVYRIPPAISSEAVEDVDLAELCANPNSTIEDWDDYLAARYGSGQTALLPDEMEPAVSEDPEYVNAWLAREMIG